MSKAKTWIPIAACAAAALLGLGVAWSLGSFKTTSGPVVTSTGAAAVGGPFTMINQNGQAVDQAILNGKWSAVFFGYTYCPDVCPLTLQALNAAAQELGAAERDFQIVFVSVDPQRDTPAQIKTWLESQGLSEATGLTGTQAQIDAMVKAYRAYARVPEGETEGYLVDHSANAWLMGPDGEFATVIASSQSPVQMAETIRSAMNQR